MRSMWQKKKECKIFLQDMSLCESSSIIKKLLVGGLFVQQLTKPRSILPNTYYTEVGNIAHLEQYLSEFAIKDFRKLKSESGFLQAFLCTVVWRYDGKICPSTKINEWQTTEHNFAVVLCLVERLSKGVSFNYFMLICFSKGAEIQCCRKVKNIGGASSNRWR